VRVRLGAVGACIAAMVLAGAPEAGAHHPGSHASRRPDGQVTVDAVAMASDACTAIAEIRSGTPPAVTPPPGSAPVTVRLKRDGEACAAVVTAVRAQAILDIAPGARQIVLYIQAPDGSLASSERVPIR
jgi:hypothetical protein